MRDQVFRRFWLAHAITVTGSWITFVSLPLLVYQRTGSALQTAVLAALEATPYLLFGLLAGAVADRLDRQRLMVGAELASSAILASIPLAAAAGALTLPHIYIAGFLAMSVYVVFDAANFGAVNALVGRDRVVDAQSAIWSAQMLLGVVGPALGGALAASLGAANAIALDAASFAACAAVLATIRRPFQLRECPSGHAPVGVVGRTLGDVREGLRFLWAHPIVRTLTLLGLGVSFTGGVIAGLLVVFAAEALGVSDGGARVGILFASGALGALAASLAVPRVQRRFGAPRVTLVTLPVDVVLLVALALSPAYVSSLLLYAAWSFAQVLVIVNGIALRQTETPDALQSRVNAAARMIAVAGTPFGAVIGGLLADAAGVRLAVLVGGLGVATSTVLAWVSPLRMPARRSAARST